MALNEDDRTWLRGEFKDLHGRITDTKVGLTNSVNSVREELRVHKATPCKDVLAHVADKHDLKKQAGLFASICAIAGAIGGFLMWLIKGAPKG